MAYEDDGLCEFSSVPCGGGGGPQSGNADAAGGNKIDKFLSKTVSGVFHTIKDALPHFDDDDDVHDHALNGAPSDAAAAASSQLLLPMLYAPSGVRVSPVWTPVATPLAAEHASSVQHHRKHSLPYDVDFRFSTSEGEVSW